MAYFYLLQSKNDKTLYAGYRSVIMKGSNDLFINYFTSSNSVKKKIQDGDIFSILEIIEFESKEDAYEFETFVLETFDAAKSTKWLNKHNNFFEPFGSERHSSLMKEKYGVTNSSFIPKVIEKRRQKWKRKTHYEKEKCRDKARETWLNRYGYREIFECPDIIEKSRKTIERRYGSMSNLKKFYNIEKTKRTNNERLGVDYPMQSPIVREKSKATIKERLGVDYPMQSPIVREKSKATIKEKTGYDHYSHIPGEMEKRMSTRLDTMREKYCVENTFQLESTKEKSKATMLEKFGVERCTDVEWICEKCGKRGKGLSNYKRWHGDNCQGSNRYRNKHRKIDNPECWECEHCGKTGKAMGNYKRWHGKNCRKIKDGI